VRTQAAYFAFLGRISPEKAVDAAIRIAQECGVPLKIAAKVDKVDVEYFETVIRPMLQPPQVEYVGEISDAEKSDFLSGAIGLLAPASWPEPFGLVLIEAMACGCPVIAYRAGAIPEVIDEGVTGFVVDNEPDAIAAAGKLAGLSRPGIRKVFERRFTARRMANDYLAVYRELIEAAAPNARSPVSRRVDSERRIDGDRAPSIVAS